MSFFKDIKEEIDQPEVAAATMTKPVEQDIIAENVSTEDEEFADDVVDRELLSNILDSTENEEVSEEILVSENISMTGASVAEVPMEKVALPKEVKEAAAEQVVSTEITSAKEARLSILEERRASSEAAPDIDTESTTVITKGTTINGSIISDCSLDVMGTINGDIECLGKLTISGKVRGNSLASEVFVNTDRLEGCITSEGSVKIGLGTVIVGDVYATSGVIAGAVKGEIDIKGPVIIDSTAIIKGNVKAKSVQMNNGAVLEGFCSLAYADFEIEDVFE